MKFTFRAFLTDEEEKEVKDFVGEMLKTRANSLASGGLLVAFDGKRTDNTKYFSIYRLVASVDVKGGPL